jgi:peptidoglycan endopeptidase LytE
MKRTRRPVLVATAIAAIILATSPPSVSAHNEPVPSGRMASATYTVKPGDNLAGIARKNGMPLDGLLAANNMTVTSVIHPGDTLRIPGSAAAASTTTAAPVASSSLYTVVSGDYLAGIANNNGVTLSALLAANSLKVSSSIHPGQVLHVPTATKPIVAAATSASSLTGGTATTPSETLVSYLRAQVGKPYKFFTAGPETFDCSGLVVAAYKQLGITLIHQSRMQATMGTAVDWRTGPLVAGDLVFTRSSDDSSEIGHVGIALDSKTWIQAVGTGIPVRIRPLPSDDRIEAVRRILQP